MCLKQNKLAFILDLVDRGRVQNRSELVLYVVNLIVIEPQPVVAAACGFWQSGHGSEGPRKIHETGKQNSLWFVLSLYPCPVHERSTELISRLPRGREGERVCGRDRKDFASSVGAGVKDKPVVDQPGSTGGFEFPIKWAPDDSQFQQVRGTMPMNPCSTDDADAPPGLVTVIQEPFGLKIEAPRASDEGMAIGHVERPSANAGPGRPAVRMNRARSAPFSIRRSPSFRSPSANRSLQPTFASLELEAASEKKPTDVNGTDDMERPLLIGCATGADTCS
jgi:Protein of unknown function (DUF3738)